MKPAANVLETAARDLASAVKEFMESGTAFEWRKVVSQSMGAERIDRATFDQVVQTAIESGLLVRRKSAAGVERLFPGPQLAPMKKQKPTLSEPKREPKQKYPTGAYPPTEPYPSDARCRKCGWAASSCLHCDRPCFDDDIYVDSKGVWACGSCNDLTFSESWGGIKRWTENERDGKSIASESNGEPSTHFENQA